MIDPTTVDEYIATAPQEARPALAEIRRRVHLVVPDTAEKISYRIATFTLGGKYFAYMAGFEDHVSIYPVTDLPELDDEMAPYRSGKGHAEVPTRPAHPLRPRRAGRGRPRRTTEGLTRGHPVKVAAPAVSPVESSPGGIGGSVSRNTLHSSSLR